MLPRPRSFVPYGERDIKLTDYKERSDGPKTRSLYIGLLINLLYAVIFALVGWILVIVTSYYVIDVFYSSPELSKARRDEYIAELCDFVENSENGNIDAVADWVRENSYVFVMIRGFSDEDSDRIVEFSGARIPEELSRDELYRVAEHGGYYRIEIDGSQVVVAIAEYTDNFYYSLMNIISVCVAVILFILLLLNYTRRLIQRIKRFESDVTIVSEIDMNYVIVSEGADEIANLSGKVEEMRQRMLGHIKSEQDAREANTELITSISHDIRTPLTVLMGYIEMMQKHEGMDEVMEGYISAAESTAQRMKALADDMFKYSLAFGSAEGMVQLEEYDARTLMDQMLSEHVLLMREQGYDIRIDHDGGIPEGYTLRTDPPNLMRIIDNIFSNMRKYADAREPIFFNLAIENSRLILECRNKVLSDIEGAESNGIGLKSCVRLARLVAEGFEHYTDGDDFVCRLTIRVKDNRG